MAQVAFRTPGTYQWVVPQYLTMTVDVRGGGGGCANSGATNSNGVAGATSEFRAQTNVYATGGGYGSVTYIFYPAASAYYWTGTNGGSGSGGNGDINDSAGGVGGQPGSPVSVGPRPDGGPGGRAQKGYTKNASGAPVPGTTITIVVGPAGGDSSGTISAGPGSVVIDYTVPPPAPMHFNMPMLGM